MMFRLDCRLFPRPEPREPREGKSLVAVLVCHAGAKLTESVRSQPSRVAVSNAIRLVSSRAIHVGSSSDFDGGSPSLLVVFILLGHLSLGVRSHVRNLGLDR